MREDHYSCWYPGVLYAFVSPLVLPFGISGAIAVGSESIGLDVLGLLALERRRRARGVRELVVGRLPGPAPGQLHRLEGHPPQAVDPSIGWPR